MDIRLNDGWDDQGSHDSNYNGAEVKTLVSQVRALPNIMTNVNQLPMGIKVFVQECLNGDTPIWVTAGIHQRWDKMRVDGVVTKSADPHIQFKFFYRYTGGERWVTGHVFLSENYALTESYETGEWARYEWKTVGVSVTWSKQYHRYPAQFTQTVSNIQDQEGGRRGRKRRNSIGLIVPEEFKQELVDAL